jgi:hypothetical protein
LLLGSTHEPAHSTSGVPQLPVQAPLEQTSPPGQAEPQPLQEAVVVMKSTHVDGPPAAHAV